MSTMLSSDATFSMEMFPFGHSPEGNGDVSSVYGCIKGGSGNSGGKGLAISMVEEAWLRWRRKDAGDRKDKAVTNFDDDIFEADQCDAFDSDVDEAPTTHTIFMANLSSEDPIYDEAGTSYDSNTHDGTTHIYVVDSDADYTSDSNIIPYDQYVEDNEEHVVQSNVSSVRNDALMSILDEMHESCPKNTVIKYSRRFDDKQMRIIISDRNRKETSLKSELHSAQLQLRSTLNHHKIMREEAIILKKDFKQKEDKFLEEFLDLMK
ncbi:hypothetical protein Tco_0080682 [Tanacetum coccineum]